MIKFDSYVSVKVYFECPKCAHTIETELPALVHAMNGNREVFCSGCERKFKLKVELLDPRSPTLREPTRPFVGAEEIYSAKAILENVGNAIENGYETLGATDIGDLLLMCISSEGSDESPHS